MKYTKLLFILLIILAFSFTANGQLRSRKAKKSIPPPISQEVKSSAAFAEIILRATELESNLQGLLVGYTKEHPKVKEIRYELNLLQKDLSNMSKMRGSETRKLNQALGKLLVRKAQITTNYWVIKSRYSDEHPDAKKAKRKVEIFEKAVRQIL